MVPELDRHCVPTPLATAPHREQLDTLMGDIVANVASTWLRGSFSSAIASLHQQPGDQSTPRKPAAADTLLSPPFTVSPAPPVPHHRGRMMTITDEVVAAMPESELEPHEKHCMSPHKCGTSANLTTTISSLPPLDELEQVTRANLKSLRQVRRGLRKARKSLEQAPIQQEVARRAGEAAGTTVVERLRRDATRRELRTGGLSSQVAWPGWRAHIALEEPGGAAGDVVLTPAIATAQARLARLADTTDLRPQRTGTAALTAKELQSRVAAARAAISGHLAMTRHVNGAHASAAAEREDAYLATGITSASASALRWATGDAALALIDETWFHCKVIGDGEQMGEALVVICEGPLTGETVIVQQNSHLRPTDGEDILVSGVRLAQAQQAYDELRVGVAESYASLSDSDREVLDRAVSELRETVEALAFHETHGRDHVPLELSRFMRMRVGLIRRRGRSRNRRREMNDERRYPVCGRCAKRARGREDTTNGSWYCHPCWAEWESGERWLQSDTATTSEILGVNLGRVVPGSWIRGSCSSAAIAAGATIVEQRRTITDLQSEVATLKRHRRELEEGYLESGELFDKLEGAQAAAQRLEAIEANIRQEQSWREQRDSDAQPTTHQTVARPRMRYNRRAVFGRNAVGAPAGDSMTRHGAANSQTVAAADADAAQRGASTTLSRDQPDHASPEATGLPPSSLRTAMIGITTPTAVRGHSHAPHGLLLAQTHAEAF